MNHQKRIIDVGKYAIHGIRYPFSWTAEASTKSGNWCDQNHCFGTTLSIGHLILKIFETALFTTHGHPNGKSSNQSLQCNRRYLLGCPPSQYSYSAGSTSHQSRFTPWCTRFYTGGEFRISEPSTLAGGFKHFAVSPPGEDYQFDGCIFFQPKGQTGQLPGKPPVTGSIPRAVFNNTL